MRTLQAAALAFVLLTAVSCHHAVAAQSAATTTAGWPATRAGELARGWVAAFSTGEDSMRAFLDASMAPASLATRSTPARVEKYRALREQYGKLQLDKVLESSPGEIAVRLMDSDARSHEFVFAVQTEAPYKLLSVSMREPSHGLHGMFSGLHDSH